jgi:hypothetical protein
MKKFLLILLLIILIPLVGIIAFLKFADFNNYKSQIEELALKYANIQLKIDGDLKVAISVKPSIELNNVAISNPDSGENIADIGNALVKFSLLPLLKKEVVVDTVQTTNTKIYLGTENSVIINDLAVGMDGFDQPISLYFDTVVSGLNISGEGKVSSFKEIQADNFNKISIDMSVNALGYNVYYKGNVDGLQDKISAAGDYEITYKENKISGKVNADLTGTLPYVKLNAESDKINVYDFTATQKTALNLFIAEANASELLANTLIPYSYLTMANADVDINIKNLSVTKDVALSNIKGNVALKSGKLDINIKNITAGTGTISGSTNVNANKKNAVVKLVGKDIVLQDLYKPLATKTNSEVYIKEGGKSSFDININTSGVDTDHYLANLDGRIIALVDKSVMKIKSLDALKGNIIVQILEALKLNVTSDDMDLTCAVVRGDISKGVVNFPKGIVVNASDFYLVANGTTNLQNDKINIELQPFSGKVSNINISSVLGSLFKISGTVTNPKVGINKEETAKAVLGAVATSGVYNAGDLLLSADSSPCYTALKGTSYSSYFPEGEKTTASNVSDTYKETKETVKNLGNQAKDTLKGLLTDLKK